MNNIGIGIMCFGDDYYFNHTKEKITHLKDIGIDCYILTDVPEQFTSSSDWDYSEYSTIKIIKYRRFLKSYHDKMILVKEILKYHNISILIDADTFISDYSLFDDLVNYQYKKGITYIETLLSHRIKKGYIRDIQMNPEDIDWFNYKMYVQKLYPQYGDLETIYEYFLVFNKEGLKDNFFQNYEKLQVIKESCDVISGKKIIVGSAEGISTHISARISDIQIQRDENLFNLIKNKIENRNIK